MNKKIKYGFFATLIISVLALTAVIIFAPYAVLQPPRINEKITPSDLKLEYAELSIKVEEKVNLKGYYILPKKDSIRGLIVLVHGIGGCKEHFLGLSDKLSNQGIASIIFDGRAHGQSGGEYCTFGFKEKKDISKIIDTIKKDFPKIPIGIWGNSLGGAIAIQALEFDKRIKFGIIESTFANLSEIVFDYKKRMLKGIGIKSLSNYLLKRAGEIGNFDPFKIQPIQSVENIFQPIFLAHGDSDENISAEYGKQLFERLSSTDKEFHLIKGGGHFDLFEKGGKEYENSILKFIEKNIK